MTSKPGSQLLAHKSDPIVRPRVAVRAGQTSARRGRSLAAGDSLPRCPKPWGGLLGIYAKPREKTPMGLAAAPSQLRNGGSAACLPDPLALGAQNPGTDFCASKQLFGQFAQCALLCSCLICARSVLVLRKVEKLFLCFYRNIVDRPHGWIILPVGPFRTLSWRDGKIPGGNSLYASIGSRA
jgi:hypothetical protein